MRGITITFASSITNVTKGEMQVHASWIFNCWYKVGSRHFYVSIHLCLVLLFCLLFPFFFTRPSQMIEWFIIVSKV